MRWTRLTLPLIGIWNLASCTLFTLAPGTCMASRTDLTVCVPDIWCLALVTGVTRHSRSELGPEPTSLTGLAERWAVD